MRFDEMRFIVHAGQAARWGVVFVLTCMALSVNAATVPAEPTAVTAETNQVTVSTGKVLASVNGVEIRSDELLVIVPMEKSVALEANRYQALVEGWIEQELVLQEAKAQGVTLTNEEQAHVNAARNLLKDVPLRTEKDRMIHAHLVRTQMRNRSVSLFMKHLLAKRGEVFKPVSKEEIEAYYQAHKGDYPALPADAKLAEEELVKIRRTIALKLDRERLAKHGEVQRKYLAELRSKAKITTVQP